MSYHTLMFGWEYPPLHLGGLGVACEGIVKGLLQNGARVTLVLPHDVKGVDGITVLSPQTLITDTSTTVFQIPSTLQPYDSFQTYDLRERLSSSEKHDDGSRDLYGRDLGAEVERYTALASDITKNVHPDIIHTHDWMTIEAGVRAANAHRKPLIAHVHATELDRTGFQPNPWIFRRELQGLRKADHVIAVSQFTKNLLVKEYGIPHDKISVLHNGMHAESVHTHEKKSVKHPLILFLGRLTVQKGAQYFIEAAKRVAAHCPDACFVIAGTGYLLPELIAHAVQAGLEHRMIFAGKVTGAEAKKLYAKASCFVMPSVSEPFGLVALEAIAQGAPVILSRQSGASEVVHNALLVDFWDIEKMTDSMITVLREEPLRREMRAQTPRILQSLTWNKQAKNILSTYNRCIHSFQHS